MRPDPRGDVVVVLQRLTLLCQQAGETPLDRVWLADGLSSEAAQLERIAREVAVDAREEVARFAADVVCVAMKAPNAEAAALETAEAFLALYAARRQS